MFKKISITRNKIVILSLVVLFIISCTHFSQQSLPTDPGNTCGSAITAAEFNSWFVSGTASLNGVVKPANSITFVPTSNCSFYKWSEQMYLWLTSPASGVYGNSGLIMNSPVFYDVSLPGTDCPEEPVCSSCTDRTFLAHTPGVIRPFNLRTAQKGMLDLPIVIDKKVLMPLEILPPVLGPNRKQLVKDVNGNELEIWHVRTDQNNQPILLDSSGKQIIGPRAIIQSESDTSVSPIVKKIQRFEKFDQSTLVQKISFEKSVFFLDLFGNFHEVEQGEAGGGGVLMAQNGSLVYYTLMVNNVYALYRTKLGPLVPSGTMFPTNEGELSAITDYAHSIGISHVVDSEALAVEVKASWVEAEGLIDADKFIKMKAIIPTYDKTNPNDWVQNGTKTVELAMVGIHVVGSTQGHPEMLWATFEHVSDCPSAAYSYSQTPSGTGNIPQDTRGKWVFCSDGSSGPFNVEHMTTSGNHIVGSPIGPSDILRTMPWGKDGTNASSNAELISTNNAVRSLLNSSDVRINYIQIGTTWTAGGGDPSTSPQVGTNRLANTTMETFFQGTNCFGCHGTNTTQVSHIFNCTAPLK